jgi:hypothetical protein
MSTNKPIPSLQELVSLFGRVASNEELDKGIRAFAAQMTLLTTHVRRVEAMVREKDQQIGELAALILAMQQKDAPAAAAPQAAPAEEAAPASEEDEAIAMAEKVQRETEEELRRAAQAAQAAPKVALVKPEAKAAASDGAA